MLAAAALRTGARTVREEQSRGLPAAPRALPMPPGAQRRRRVRSRLARGEREPLVSSTPGAITHLRLRRQRHA